MKHFIVYLCTDSTSHFWCHWNYCFPFRKRSPSRENELSPSLWANLVLLWYFLFGFDYKAVLIKSVMWVRNLKFTEITGMTGQLQDENKGQLIIYRNNTSCLKTCWSKNVGSLKSSLDKHHYTFSFLLTLSFQQVAAVRDGILCQPSGQTEC